MKIDCLAVVFLLNGISIDASCPNGCSCKNLIEGLNLFCYGRRLKYIPTVPKDTSKLYMHNNMISTIESNTFINMTNLTIVTLDKNNISIIKQFAFVDLPRLQHININDNQITTIERYAFVDTPSLYFMNLTSNPINCDCGVYPFWSWLNERKSINVEATCSNGTFITSLGSSELEKCNPDNCQCLNDGECVMTGSGSVTCNCTEPWTGEVCQGKYGVIV
ncbi:protein slit-like [Mytilus trossulus]|uniref:protein slit-like n=1 Tax=Mytilus trossulus TaxID=6551 RepID=UPI0030077FDE